MWTTDGSKRLISSKDVPFEGVNNVPLHFGSQKPPKTEILVPWIALSIVNVFARSLLPRVYIAECFWFFCVVVEVQKVPFGSRAFLRLLVGELGTPKIAQILLWEMPVYIHSYTTVWSGPKTAQNVSFRAAICLFRCRCEWCSPKFWVNTPKTEILVLVPWIGLSIVNDKKSNAYNFNTAMPIMTKFLHGIAPVNGPSWVVPRRPHKNTENGDGGHIEFHKKC